MTSDDDGWMDWEDTVLQEISQRKTNIVWSSLHTESKSQIRRGRE